MKFLLSYTILSFLPWFFMIYALHKFSIDQTNQKRFALADVSLRRPAGGSNTYRRRGLPGPIVVNMINNVINWLPVLCSCQSMAWDNSSNW
jgi:hypothetical protein